MTLVFVGDWLPARELDVSDLFGKQSVIGNLECVIASSSASGDKAFSVVLDEIVYRYVRKSGFAALSVANNHVYDAGPAVFREMLARLNDFSEIQFYGTTDNPYASIEQTAVIGCLEPCRSRGKDLFHEEDVHGLLRQLRPQFDRIVVTPHWGKESEYAHQPSPRQRYLAASWIQAGADGVIGHHPHVIQGREMIEGKPIFYSAGNFEFLHEEGRAYPATTYGLRVDWDPATNKWSHDFVTTSSESVGLVPSGSAEEQLLREFVESLSRSLADSSSGSETLTWARRIGPVYIPKSFRSWRRRMQNRFLLNFAKCCVWCIMPTTLLLILGWLFKDQRYLREAAATFEQLSRDENVA